MTEIEILTSWVQFLGGLVAAVCAALGIMAKL